MNFLGMAAVKKQTQPAGIVPIQPKAGGLPGVVQQPKPVAGMAASAGAAGAVGALQNTKAVTGMAASQVQKPLGFVPPTASVLGYNDALGQANQQLDPGFNRAVAGIAAQKQNDTLNAGETSSAHGGAHSGLAADLVNKVGIAASNQRADLDAQRASQAATIAQQLVQQSQDRADQLRRDAFDEYIGSGQLGLSRDQFDYSKNRDTIGDSRYTDETTYNRGRDTVADSRYTDETSYNRGRDTVADTRYNTETAYNHGRDAIGDKRYSAETAYSHGRDAIGDKRYASETTYNHGRDARADQVDDRNYSRGVYESNRGYSQSASNTAADNARANGNAEYGRLMDVWQATGVAPKGLESYGVQPGTPLAGKQSSEPASVDPKNSTNNVNSLIDDLSSDKTVTKTRARQLLQANSAYLTDADYKRMSDYIDDNY